MPRFTNRNVFDLYVLPFTRIATIDVDADRAVFYIHSNEDKGYFLRFVKRGIFVMIKGRFFLFKLCSVNFGFLLNYRLRCSDSIVCLVCLWHGMYRWKLTYF